MKNQKPTTGPEPTTPCNQESLYRAIFENSSAAIAILDSDTTISMINKAFCEMSGYDAEELIGTSWMTKMPMMEVERLRNFNSNRLKGASNIPTKYEFTYYTKQGEIKSGLLSASVIQWNQKTIVSFTDITERKKAEEAQRISEERYRSLIEHANDIVYTITIEGIITFASHNWTEQLGYEVEEIEGNSFSKFVRTEDIERLAALVRKNYENGEKLSGIEYQIRHKNGQWYWYSSSSSPQFDSNGKVEQIIGIAHNITERKHAEEALQKSQALLNTLVQTIPDLIWLKDPDGVYLSCNTMFERFFGAPANQIIGKTDSDFVSKELADSFRKNDLLAIEKGTLTNIEAWVTFADDRHEALLDILKTPMYAPDGKLIGVLGIARDITQRKKIEDQLRELNATKDKFFAIIAHDLRSPFTSLLGLTEIMASENSELSPNQYREFSRIMFRTTESTFHLLENLLQWARLQRRVIQFNPENILLNDFIYELKESIFESARKKQVKLRFNFTEKFSIRADRNMLETTFRNLISNAIKFSQNNSIVEISVLSIDEQTIAFSVEDHGIGMNSKIMEQLFRIDAHVSRPGTSGEPSSGLGLILCKEFVEMHGGKIWAESQEGKGSTFFFTLKQ